MRSDLPPRATNLVKFLRNHHQEQVQWNLIQDLSNPNHQVDKLVLKNQMEMGIVEDIRSFVKQK